MNHLHARIVTLAKNEHKKALSKKLLRALICVTTFYRKILTDSTSISTQKLLFWRLCLVNGGVRISLNLREIRSKAIFK